MQEKIDKLIKFIEESNNIVFFGGAGVSTESSIPDFRSKNGLYNQHDVQFDNYEPEYLLSHSCLCNESKVFYEFYRQKMNVSGIEPNITHKVLAKLEATGKLKAVITQNIDGLHQKAGSKNVLEIHGTIQKNYCSKCKKEYPANYIFESKDPIPMCKCGGIIRPDVTLYEENLPKAADEACLEIFNADCLIIGGTSLKVYPAASFVHYFRGNHLIVINNEELKIELNKDSDLFIKSNLGSVFKEINKRMFEEGK